MQPILSVRDLRKSFATLEVLKGIDLDVFNGDVICVIGPSGSGKSTLIRCINMLETPTLGTIRFKNQRVGTQFTSKGNLVGTGELRKRVGMVFQNFNLYPHRTVLQNITQAPILVNKENEKSALAYALELLEKVGLTSKQHEYPNHLSGGQKQRVAIARALAMRPDVLLLDEVTSALDPELVSEVLQVIQDLAKQGMTMIVVTHEMDFAADVASRIVFMEDGQVVETGDPKDLLRLPKTDRLKSFLARHLR